MPKSLIRIVAIFLIPCLIADPALASGMPRAFLQQPVARVIKTDLFSQQAIPAQGVVSPLHEIDTNAHQKHQIGLKLKNSEKGFSFIETVAAMWAISLLSLSVYTLVFARGSAGVSWARAVYLFNAFRVETPLVIFLVVVGIWLVVGSYSDVKDGLQRHSSKHTVLYGLHRRVAGVFALAAVFLHIFTQNYFELTSRPLIPMNRWWTNHASDFFAAYAYPTLFFSNVLKGYDKPFKTKLSRVLMASGITFLGSYVINHKDVFHAMPFLYAVTKNDPVDFLVELPMNFAWFVVNWFLLYLPVKSYSATEADNSELHSQPAAARDAKMKRGPRKGTIISILLPVLLMIPLLSFAQARQTARAWIADSLELRFQDTGYFQEPTPQMIQSTVEKVRHMDVEALREAFPVLMPEISPISPLDDPIKQAVWERYLELSLQDGRLLKDIGTWSLNNIFSLADVMGEKYEYIQQNQGNPFLQELTRILTEAALKHFSLPFGGLFHNGASNGLESLHSALALGPDPRWNPLLPLITVNADKTLKALEDGYRLLKSVRSNYAEGSDDFIEMDARIYHQLHAIGGLGIPQAGRTLATMLASADRFDVDARTWLMAFGVLRANTPIDVYETVVEDMLNDLVLSLKGIDESEVFEAKKPLIIYLLNYSDPFLIRSCIDGFFRVISEAAQFGDNNHPITIDPSSVGGALRYSLSLETTQSGLVNFLTRGQADEWYGYLNPRRFPKETRLFILTVIESINENMEKDFLLSQLQKIIQDDPDAEVRDKAREIFKLIETKRTAQTEVKPMLRNGTALLSAA